MHDRTVIEVFESFRTSRKLIEYKASSESELSLLRTLAIGERHLPGEEHHPESGTLVIPTFESNTQDDSTSNDSLGTGIIASPQPLAEKFDYALENDFATSLTDDEFSSSEPIPYLPEEDLDADSFFSEFEDSLLDDLLAIS